MALHSSGHNITKTLTVPDDIALPLVPTDYLTIDLCTKALREGRLGVAAAQNFLYCSILVPHPPCVHSPVTFRLSHPVAYPAGPAAAFPSSSRATRNPCGMPAT